MIIYDRRGLDESLEAFAKRYDLAVEVARTVWRQESLRLLHVPPANGRYYTDALVECGLCRIAPGVAVPTAAVTWSDEP